MYNYCAECTTLLRESVTVWHLHSPVWLWQCQVWKYCLNIRVFKVDRLQMYIYYLVVSSNDSRKIALNFWPDKWSGQAVCPWNWNIKVRRLKSIRPFHERACRFNIFKIERALIIRTCMKQYLPRSGLNTVQSYFLVSLLVSRRVRVYCLWF